VCVRSMRDYVTVEAGQATTCLRNVVCENVGPSLNEASSLGACAAPLLDLLHVVCCVEVGDVTRVEHLHSKQMYD
jgi:hypothetical protein